VFSQPFQHNRGNEPSRNNRNEEENELMRKPADPIKMTKAVIGIVHPWILKVEPSARYGVLANAFKTQCEDF
jgi:hypothetical protein